jgi:SAM-dependent methyltransferase
VIEIQILNCGCGSTSWGDVRLDLYRSPSTNVLGDIERGLPFKAEVFDKVLCYNVLEHMANPSALLEEIGRVLKQNGLLTLRTDNASYWRFHVGPVLGRKLGLPFAGIHSGRYENEQGRGAEDRHYAFFTIHHLRNHLERAGFEVEWLDYWPRHVRPSRVPRLVPPAKPYISSFLNAEARKPCRPGDQ